jgi:hypothetical protein
MRSPPPPWRSRWAIMLEPTSIAPCHFDSRTGARSIDEMPLETFFTKRELAGAREQLLGNPLADLNAQAAAGEVLAVWSAHHASTGADFFHQLRAHRVRQIHCIIADAVGLKLAGARVHVPKLAMVGNPSCDCSQSWHSGFGTDRAEALFVDQTAADRVSDLFCVFGRLLGCGLPIVSNRLLIHYDTLCMMRYLLQDAFLEHKAQ